MSAWPPRAAVFKALKPVVVGVAIDAPRSISSSQTSSRPFWHATRSGVTPSRSRSTAAPSQQQELGALVVAAGARVPERAAPRLALVVDAAALRVEEASHVVRAAAAGGGDELHWCCGGVALVGQPQSAFLHLLAAIYPRESTGNLGFGELASVST